ncbi:hypothetical protein NHQ30_005722 [Ciborinia camelliae]|nr:hypothetical protein NHQ30_005722 [Ciborinia camelliae]
MKSSIIALVLSGLCASVLASASPTDGLTIITTDENGNEVETYKGRYEDGPAQKLNATVGLTIITTDENGNEVAQYMGRYEDGLNNISISSSSATSSPTRPSDNSKRRTGKHVGTKCGKNTGFSTSDYQVALQGLANYFGNGQKFSRKIWYTYGNAVVFGCDYGDGQQVTSAQLYSDLGAVDAACGNAKTGWYDHEPWKASYGRAIRSQVLDCADLESL